jgi:hypothetical protein
MTRPPPIDLNCASRLGVVLVVEEWIATRHAGSERDIPQVMADAAADRACLCAAAGFALQRREQLLTCARQIRCDAQITRHDGNPCKVPRRDRLGTARSGRMTTLRPSSECSLAGIALSCPA